MRFQSITGIAAFALFATPSFAVIIGPGGGGSPPCIEGHCPGPYSGPPVAFPSVTERIGGRTEVNPVTGNSVTGYNSFQSNYVPIGGVDVTEGDAVSGDHVKVVADFSGLTASVLTSAQAEWANPAKAGMTYSYLFHITATDMAAADALSALVDYNPFQLKAVGSYAVSASGSGVAGVGITSGYLGVPLIPPNGFTEFRCDPGGYVYQGGVSSGCGNSTFSVDVGIVRASHLYFNNDPAQVGSALDFYGEVSIYAFAQAGNVGSAVDPAPGTLNGPAAVSGLASAFIDPVFKLPGSLNGYSFVINGAGGQQQALGFVPEPAQWAMLIGGFGLIGGYARTRRSLKPA